VNSASKEDPIPAPTELETDGAALFVADTEQHRAPIRDRMAADPAARTELAGAPADG
jgi:hypothetical protein